jgi:biopolymer transport protein ExbB/TolQ
MARRGIALRELIGRMSRHRLNDYRQQRLIAAARYVEQTGSAERLDDELKYLADIDAQRQSDGFAFVRILIWAIPMLGFLGTVLGITQALGSIEVGPGNDFQQMMTGLRTGLYVAFDTTAQALSFSIALMFVQFVVVRCETQLLDQVDRQVRHDLAGWFEWGSGDGDHYVRTVQRIGRSILAATHQMSQTQIELWKRSIEAAQQAWVETIQGNHELIQHNLSDAIESSVERMAQRLDESIQRADAALEHRGQQWQVHLSQLARQTHEQQQTVISTTQTAIAALRGRSPAGVIEPRALLDATTSQRTMQQLNLTLEALTAQLMRMETPDAAAANAAELRIFDQDAAA